MPYSSIADIPEHIKRKYKSAKKRRQWLHVWNSVYRQTHSEARAFAAANSITAKKSVFTRQEVDELISFYVTGDFKGKYEA